MRHMLSVSALLLATVSIAWAAPESAELKKPKSQALQRVQKAAKDLKKQLGSGNTSLVAVAKAPDMNVRALVDSIGATRGQSITVSETVFDPKTMMEVMTRDLGDARVDLKGMWKALSALEEASEQEDFELQAVTFDDWQAHTTLSALVIFDMSAGEALLVGFTNLSW